MLLSCKCEGRYNQKRMKLTKTLKRFSGWHLTILFNTIFNIPMPCFLWYWSYPYSWLISCDSSTWGLSKNQREERKSLRRGLLKCDKGIHGFNSTKGQSGWAGQEENVIFRLPPRLMEKWCWIRHSTGVRTAWLLWSRVLGAGSRGNMQLVMGKALCGKLVNGCLSFKEVGYLVWACGSAGSNRIGVQQGVGSAVCSALWSQHTNSSTKSVPRNWCWVQRDTLEPWTAVDANSLLEPGFIDKVTFLHDGLNALFN